jgi:hypothetical protein
MWSIRILATNIVDKTLLFQIKNLLKFNLLKI